MMNRRICYELFPFFTDIEGWLCVTVGGGEGRIP